MVSFDDGASGGGNDRDENNNNGAGSNDGDVGGSKSPSSAKPLNSSLNSSRGLKRSFLFAKPTKEKNPRWGDEPIPVFGLLPDELIIRIQSFMDPPLIGTLAQCSRKFNELSHDLPLWRELSTKGDWNTRRNNGNQVINRAFYVQKFLSFRRQERLREELRAETARVERRLQSIATSTRVMLTMFYARPYEWIWTFGVILFTIFAVLKLDKTVHWSWGLVFIPLLFISYQLVFAPLVYDCMRARHNHDFENDLSPGATGLILRPIFFLFFFLLPLQRGKAINQFLVYTPIITVVTFIAALVAKLTATHDPPWWGVMLPLILFGAYLILAPFLARGTIFDDDKWLDRVIPACGSVMFTIFVILLTLKLEHKTTMSWWSVIMPLIVMKVFFMVVPVALTFFSHFCCNFWLTDRSRWTRDPGACCMVAAGVSILILAPLLAFEIIMAQQLEHQRTTKFSLLFVPLFLLEGFGVCGCCAINLAVQFD